MATQTYITRRVTRVTHKPQAEAIPVARKRGRPRKHPLPVTQATAADAAPAFGPPGFVGKLEILDQIASPDPQGLVFVDGAMPRWFAEQVIATLEAVTIFQAYRYPPAPTTA